MVPDRTAADPEPDDDQGMPPADERDDSDAFGGPRALLLPHESADLDSPKNLQAASCAETLGNSEDLEDLQAPASQTLSQAVARLGIDVSTDKLAKLDQYCLALWALNEKVNLTRHTSYDLFARRDLLDTFQLAQFLKQGEEVLDVGTGGGVPGIPLAILRPDLKVSLCDSVGKKARAAEELVFELKLPVYVHAMRVQDVLEEHTFDTLVTRAAGSITQVCNWLQPHWHCFNRLLAIKGPKWVEERADARHRGVLHGIRLRRIHGYKMPGTKSESVLLQLEKPRPGSSG